MYTAMLLSVSMAFQPGEPPVVSEPWDAELTSKLKAIWPKGVEFDNQLKFYTLSRRYQNLFTMNNGTFKGRNIDPIHDEPLTQSGGMAGLQGWGSGKGLLIPKGKKIVVWEENTNVQAFAPVPRWRWKFPEGAVAYDVLWSKQGIFEIRTQTRSDEGWETKIAFKEEKNAPAGYKGAGQSCASCHNQTAQVVGIPSRIYLMVRWGDDGRFSWRPFDNAGALDPRWPISTK